jgi:hypothetical protein
MPRIVNHPDRLAAFREVSATLVATEGVEALNLDRVGAKVLVSADTVRRTIRTARVLPQLAIEHLEHTSRLRVFRRHGLRPAEDARTSWRHAIEMLRDEAPVTEDLADEARVWHRLTGLATTPRALEAVAGRQAGLQARAAHVVRLSRVPDGDEGDAVLVLLALVRGLGVAVSEGWATHEDADRLLSAHLATLTPSDLASTPVAPHVNDR